MSLFNKINSNWVHSNNLFVGQLNSAYVDDAEDDIENALMYKEGKINYIFERRNNKYYEVLSNSFINTKDSCHSTGEDGVGCTCSNIGELYAANLKPIKEYIKDIKSSFPKDYLLYVFDKIN